MIETLEIGGGRVELISGPADASSEEYRYLRRMVMAEIRRAFGGNGLAGRRLVFGRGTLVLAPTLRAMAATLDSGEVVCSALPLASLLGHDGIPGRIFTLGEFERAEEIALAAATEVAPPPGPLPLLLIANSEDGGADGEALLGAHPAAVRAGVCHGFADYYGQLRDDVLPLLPGGLESVLEVGCGRGSTGALIRERLGCKVTGVELNPEIAAIAAEELDEVVCIDIEEAEFAQRFDALIAFELFEHLRDPDRFLDRCREIVKPGGVIVLSTPNVGHYAIVEQLIAGRFDYIPVGLLCNTHLRFFTRRSLELALDRAGFEHFEITAQRTGHSERIEQLVALGGDADSLATSGFYVRIENR